MTMTKLFLHPIVNHYKDESGDLITEEHLMILTNRVYDKFAVKTFEEISLSEIKKSISIKRILQHCNNCSGQYKSFGPFQFISESNVLIVQTFFGARHGKSEADGVVGHIKQ